MMNAYQEPDVDDHDRVGVCHYPGRTAYSCHLYRDRCADLGVLCGANGSGPRSPAANFDFVVGGTGLGTPIEVRSPMSTGLVDMRLKEAEEDLEEPLAGDLAADPGEQNYHRLAGS